MVKKKAAIFYCRCVLSLFLSDVETPTFKLLVNVLRVFGVGTTKECELKSYAALKTFSGLSIGVGTWYLVA